MAAAPHLMFPSPFYSFPSHGNSESLHSSKLLIPTLPQTSPAVRHMRLSGGRTSKLHAPSVTKDQGSLSSMITELQLDQQEEELDDLFLQSPKLGRGLRMEEHLADRWREIHGRDDWAGLLDPMDPLLRSELIRYGDFAQACYDAFDYDPFSLYCGSCKYNRRNFFQRLGMADAGYDVTRYLYATSSIDLPNFFCKSKMDSRVWSNRANWIGYIAVSNDAATARLGRRDILIAWRGTVTRLEWVADLMDFLQPVRSEGIPSPDPAIKVESGFFDLYTSKDPLCRFCKYSAREQVLAEVRKLLRRYTSAGEKVSLSVTGHSLGSALAMLSAYDIVETGVDAGADVGRVPVSVFSFSGPRVGNEAFKRRFDGLGIKAIRVVNKHDTVPKVPGIFFNEGVPEFVRKLVDGLPWTYSHVGVELELDHKHSPFLKETNDPSNFHNLEALLHTIDGYHGKGQRFVLGSGRDPALVNKACDFLKDHHMIPPHWRQDHNKGMILANHGRWVQQERKHIDDHGHPDDEDDYHTRDHLRQLGLLVSDHHA